MKFGPAPGRLPPDVRVYAIGDVHGCANQLAALHAQIAGDRMFRSAPRVVVVHLGDYVDRGPDSAGVVEMLGSSAGDVETINLMGNHERAMLDALAGDKAARTDWLFNGGGAALESWGIDPGASAEEWRDKIPVRHLATLRGLRLSFQLGSYFFVHAGVRPGVKLEDQAASDLLAIRQMFLSSEADFGAVVVHGHTPKEAPVVRANRIGIDTGAVYGGPLTCAVLEADGVAFLQA